MLSIAFVTRAVLAAAVPSHINEVLAATTNPKSIDALITELNNGDARAFEPLIAALGDPANQAFDRWSIAEALGHFHDPRAVGPLIAALGAKDVMQIDGTMDHLIAAALREIGAPAVDPLLAAMKSADPTLQLGAISVWESFSPSSPDEPRVTRALVVALSDPDRDISETAAWVLGNNRSLHCVELLIPLLKNPDSNVRQRTAQILGEIQDPLAKDPLTAALTDPDAAVQQQAKDALAAIGIANANGPRPASAPHFKVISDLDLTAAFHTRTQWRSVTYQKPDSCNPAFSVGGCNGEYVDCVIRDGKLKCSEVGGVGTVLEGEEIVTPRHSQPLLVGRSHPDVVTPGSGTLYTEVSIYDRNSDALKTVFVSASSRNNNEETRIMVDGPLSGDIIVASAPGYSWPSKYPARASNDHDKEPFLSSRWPYHYGISVYRLSSSLEYVQTLRYVARASEIDGDPLAVIDMEMPEIERRLHLWRPGDPLPAPARMPSQCKTYELRRDGDETCH